MKTSEKIYNAIGEGYGFNGSKEDAIKLIEDILTQYPLSKKTIEETLAKRFGKFIMDLSENVHHKDSVTKKKMTDERMEELANDMFNLFSRSNKKYGLKWYKDSFVPSPDGEENAIEFVEWRDKYFENSLFGRWEYINNPERGNWSDEELYNKFVKETKTKK